MPKQIVFTKDDIIEAAFKVFKEEGMAGVSARKIAAKLKCSTAPVYTSFNSIDELKDILLEKSLQLLLKYTEKEYTQDYFLNIGVGMLEFAKEYRFIYRTLFIESNTYQNILEEFTRKNLIQMKKEASLKILEEDLKEILEKLTVYTHGLASFICADMLEDTSQDYFIKALGNIGGDIIGGTALRRGKLQEYLKCHRKREGL
ncbi:transcriptional regulator, TetR family [Natronincola peptidivorans]|uniref:Transcriptional regulator, TetR family n=1 Tax=Natronincola peptidivorans TaxID=426128 RepID=A0A1I0DRN4_9FIRM|nr:helix-turn-helix domain-containing protein [Natronincola peptidivorans]SET34424.1 transcriptional regulator, TetR family [Natronincola peptidivorans]